MIGISKKIFKSLTDQISKLSLLHNASATLGNASESAQEKMCNLHRTATKQYTSIVKQINGSTIVQDINTALLKPSSLPKRLVNYWQWYEQLIGMDKVEIAKQQVIIIQDKLFKCQEQRRLLTHQATSLNEKLKEIYSELVQTKRDDPKYVQLTILENKGLQEQIKVTIQLELLENEERDYFTQLATAIKEYHDTQAMNAQKYKYISFLASALLAIVSLTGSIFYNNKRIADVRNVIKEAQNSIETNVNKKFIEIIKRFESDDKVISSAIIIPRLTHTNSSQTEDIIDKNNIKEDNSLQEIDKTKQIIYYLGLAVCTMYFLQQIFKS